MFLSVFMFLKIVGYYFFKNLLDILRLIDGNNFIINPI